MQDLQLLSQFKMSHIEQVPPNRVAKFFSQKTILVTGGSGFLGKVLVEKLSRSCGSLKRIYLILRPKKGKNADQRLQEILAGPLFDSVRSQLFDKVKAVPGEMSAENLGLSPEDRQMLIEETEIIYHSAATVKFDDPLKDTVMLNVRGTKLLLELAKECKKLMVFSYISTAYCHEDQEVAYEKFYPPPNNPHAIIKMCETLDRDDIDSQAKGLRGKNVNNYTYSKALAEALVEEQIDTLPVIVMRPSAVIPIWREPIPGWTDNINGPTGLLIGAGKGVIRTMYAREDIFIDCVFADIVANTMIGFAYDYHTHKARRIFHITASEETDRIGVSLKKVIDWGRVIINNRVAFSKVLWYPNGSIKQSRVHHYVAFFLYQLLPAILIDSLLSLVGVKPFLVKVQKRIWNGYQILEYYANRKWVFDNENTKVARSLMNSTEREVFKMDAEGLDIYEYFVNCILASRRYLMHEPDEDIEAALTRMKMLRYVDAFCKMLFVLTVFYFIYKWTFRY